MICSSDSPGHSSRSPVVSESILKETQGFVKISDGTTQAFPGFLPSFGSSTSPLGASSAPAFGSSSSSSFVYPPCGQKHAFGSFAPFGASSHPVAASNRTFDTTTAPAFATSTTPLSDSTVTSTLDNPSAAQAFGNKNSLSSLIGPIPIASSDGMVGATQASSGFLSTFGSSTSPLGASSTPTCGCSSSSFVFPPCRQKCAFVSFSPCGASNHPVPASNRTFDTTAAPAFATSTTPLSDSTVTSTLGNTSATQVFGNINSLSSLIGPTPIATSDGMVGATQASPGFLSTFGSSTSPLGASSTPACGCSSSSFVFPPCEQKHAFGSFAPFGASSHPVAARNRTFDTTAAPAFATSTTSLFDSIVTSMLGNPSSAQNINSLSLQTGSIPVGTSAGMVGATQASSGFLSTFGSSTSPLGASSAPAFGSSSSSSFVFPPCGQKCAGGSFSPFGASSHPVAASNRTFDTTTAPAFATSTTPLFDSTVTSTLGNPSAANYVSTASTFVSGIASPASSSFPFGASSAPAFGSSSPFGIAFQASGNSSSGASTTPSAFGVGSTCPFCQSTSRTQIPPLGTPTMGAAFVGTVLGQSVFDGRLGGSRVAVYNATTAVPFCYDSQREKIVSISAMHSYSNISPEELRWEDYQLGDKGGFRPFNSFSLFPSTSAWASAPGAAHAPAPSLNFVPSEGQMNAALRWTTGFGCSSTVPSFGQLNTITIPMSPIGFGQILLTSTPILLHPNNVVGFGQTNPNFFTLLQPVGPFFSSNFANSPFQFLHLR